MANYLPVLLVSVNANSIPDDSNVTTLPRGQVDYLSHDWEEEDVWRSWRNMTRQKNEITNGMRLENASWRTWWKQRNKLKTVSPETLNWLKDSDVTWLYGPLHTAVDWAPPPKPKPDPTSVDDKMPSSAHDRLDLNVGSGKKPILKHRSIGELLTSDLANSPLFTGDTLKQANDLDGIKVPEDIWVQNEDLGDSDHREICPRPVLIHTKSDTHITRWANRAFRKESPPRVLAEEPKLVRGMSVSTPESAASGSSVYSPDKSNSMGHTSGSDQENNGTATNAPRKKHISFNTFVEQCIAIEKPKNIREESDSGTDTPRSRAIYEMAYDDGYDEDSESGLNEEDDDDVEFIDSASSEHHHEHYEANSNSDSDDDEDEDEVLEIRSINGIPRQRPSAGRSSSSSSSSGSSRSRSTGGNKPPSRQNSTQSSLFRTHSSNGRLRHGPALLRTPSSEKEHMTIAPIAPTILKTKGVGNGSGDDDDEYDYPIGHIAGKWGDKDIPVHLVYVPPLGSNYSMEGSEVDDGDDVYRHREAYFTVGTGQRTVPVVPNSNGQVEPVLFRSAPVVSSPAQGPEEDAYDYFGGPDLGEAFAEKRTRSYANRKNGDVTKEGAGSPVLRYAQGGAASVVGGRSSVNPEVTVNGVKGDATATEDRSRLRSRSSSRSRTPSPSEFIAASNAPLIPPPSAAVAVPRVGSSHGISPPNTSSNSSSLLSPPDSVPSRGRSSAPVAENMPRGRSSTRTSSFSDRDRSGSRGTSSPIGSISPDGSSATIAIGSVYSVYTNGRVPIAVPDKSSPSERGRDPVGKRLGDSPENVRTSALGRYGDGKRVLSTDSSTSSGSSTVSAPSTAVPNGATVGSPLRNSIPVPGEPPSGKKTLPITIPVDEEQQRSRHPTPANSPVLSMKRSLPPPQLSSPSTTISDSNAKGIVSRSPPSSPISVKALDDGTLVGRAVEIVTSAGAFLGAIWHGT